MAEPLEPPADAEDWTDDQWIAWLDATDPDGERDEFGERAPGEPAFPARLLGAAMVGLHRAIYGAQDDETVEVQDASGDPPGDDPLELRIDPDHPEETVVVVRPWLLHGDRAGGLRGDLRRDPGAGGGPSPGV